MKTDIWMPLYIKDLMADTLHLNTLQFGAYLLLICHYWEKEKLEINHAQNICRMSDDQWIQNKDIILGFFKEKNGMFFHKRIEEELKKSKHFRDEQSRKGQLGAKKRWKEDDSRGYTPAIAQAIPNDSPAPTPLPISKNINKYMLKNLFPNIQNVFILLDECEKTLKENLNDFEKRFITDIVVNVKAYGGNTNMTRKQLLKIIDIISKYNPSIKSMLGE